MKLLIVYYSYSGITRRLAEDIAFVKTVFLLNIANTIAPIKTTTKPTEPMIIDFLDNFKDFITKNQLLFWILYYHITKNNSLQNVCIYDKIYT